MLKISRAKTWLDLAWNAIYERFTCCVKCVRKMQKCTWPRGRKTPFCHMRQRRSQNECTFCSFFLSRFISKTHGTCNMVGLKWWGREARYRMLTKQKHKQNVGWGHIYECHLQVQIFTFYGAHESGLQPGKYAAWMFMCICHENNGYTQLANEL